jgi:LysR family transcriptional regulator, regulator for bpeEF and oprC
MALEQLATLVAVVDANGFAAAARATNLRKATVSQRIQQLEKRLGVSLLVRTTRSLRLTDEGRAYVEQARRALEAAAQAEQVIAAAKRKPVGVLRVTMHAALASMIFESVVLRYMANNPDVSVHIDTSMRQIDLAREGFDLALRTGPLAESSFIARRIGMMPRIYTASPRWVATHGGLRRPEDLAQHPTIVIEKEGRHEWPFVVNGRARVVPIRPRLIVSTFDLGVRAAVAGLGVLRSPEHYVESSVVAKTLVPVLAEWTPPPVEVYAVFPSGGALVPKTRVFIDALTTWLEKRRQRLVR